jgi:hypothetical protein
MRSISVKYLFFTRFGKVPNRVSGKVWYADPNSNGSGSGYGIRIRTKKGKPIDKKRNYR